MSATILSNVIITGVKRVQNSAAGNPTYVLICQCDECPTGACHMTWRTALNAAIGYQIGDYSFSGDHGSRHDYPFRANLRIARNRVVGIDACTCNRDYFATHGHGPICAMANSHRKV